MSVVTDVAKQVSSVVAKNSPAILTAVGVAGVVSTAFLAVKATPEALEIVESAERGRIAEYDEGDSNYIPALSHVDMIKITWRCYIPAALMGGATIACIIGATTIGTRRNAALLSVYTLTETALSEYKAKIVETIGEKKAEAIKDLIAQDHLDQNPLSANTVIMTGDGDTLCYDEISGRYFKSNIEKLRKAQNDLNRDLINEAWISLNHFYGLIGLGPIKLGEDMGWLPDNLVELRFSARLADDNTPCIVLDYTIDPKSDRYYR